MYDVLDDRFKCILKALPLLVQQDSDEKGRSIVGGFQAWWAEIHGDQPQAL